MHISNMEVSPLNQVLASNLARLMEKRGLTQMALAKKCGIGQTTISLYLNPERRKPGKDAKPGSAKLTEVEMLAGALEVAPWELVRPYDQAEQEVYDKIEAAYRVLQTKEQDLAAKSPPPSKPPAPAKKAPKTPKQHA